jgi:hypothetical protein
MTRGAAVRVPASTRQEDGADAVSHWNAKHILLMEWTCFLSTRRLKKQSVIDSARKVFVRGAAHVLTACIYKLALRSSANAAIAIGEPMMAVSSRAALAACLTTAPGSAPSVEHARTAAPGSAPLVGKQVGG